MTVGTTDTTLRRDKTGTLCAGPRLVHTLLGAGGSSRAPPDWGTRELRGGCTVSKGLGDPVSF